MSNRRNIAALALVLAALCVATAQAAGGFRARALRPAYDSSSLELVGGGVYRTKVAHPQLQVTVCLRKRFGRRFFAVRCATATGRGRRVTGQVSVPGCVPGVWRTTAVGGALNRRGAWIGRASSVSRRFRC
jgi:hypothetical protein